MKIILVGSLAKERYFPKDIDYSTTEVWGLNAIYPKFVPAWSRRFNLHTYENLQRYKWKPEFFYREVDFSNGYPGIPFYTIDEWPEPYKLAGQKLLPVSWMDDSLRRNRYHSGSFDWMVAFAIYLDGCGDSGLYQQVDEIIIHGCALTMEAGEPISARACLEYWCGVAEGKGIKVTVAEDSALFDFYHLVRSDLCYGLDDTPVIEHQDRGEITSRLTSLPPSYDYED